MAETYGQSSLIILLFLTFIYCEKFGYKNSLTCHCNGGTCDKETGFCPSGKCQRGWSGPSCQRQNVALNKPATQSSYYVEPYPDISEDVMSGYAVDGDTSHNSTLGLNPSTQSKCVDMPERYIGWWTVDLQQTYHLNTIKIYHREGWLTRFTRASVNIIDEDGQSSKCYQNEQQPTSSVFTINCVGTGRYLNFTQSTGQGILNLCEIEVYVCSVGTFGSECTKFCHCKKNTRCDDVTGYCPDGCLPGWEGESCNQSCSDTHRYGDACRSRCVDRNCFGNSPCDHVTGNCIEGCKRGFMGADCMQNCDQGFYGVGCKLKCTERKCLNMTSSCDHVTGTCDEGCQEGYNGDDCTKRVEKSGTTLRPPPIDVIAGSIVAVIVVIILVTLGVVLYKRYQRRRENVYNKPNTISHVETYDTLSPTSPNEGNTTLNSSSQDYINTNGASEGEITPTSKTSDGITNNSYYNTPVSNGTATRVAVTGTNNKSADDIGYYNVDNIGQTKGNDKTVKFSDAVKDENIYVDIED